MKHIPRWYMPSWNGDLRLVPDGEHPDKTILSIESPTPAEEAALKSMGKLFLEHGFVDEWTTRKPGFFARVAGKKHAVLLNAPLEKVGALVVPILRPGPAVLTTIVFRDGQCMTAHGDAVAALVASATAEKPPSSPYRAEPDAPLEPATPPAETALAKVEKEPKAAATVKKPTPSCPQCQPGAVGPASEVLLTFLSESQHEDWAKSRFIVVEGGLSGHRYILAHRHTPLAQRFGRICFDVDTQCVVHFHDWRVPPEEEVLAAKLILESRYEPWLRNEATMLGAGAGSLVFKNPFGDYMDGVADAHFTQKIGVDFMRALSLELLRASATEILQLL